MKLLKLSLRSGHGGETFVVAANIPILNRHRVCLSVAVRVFDDFTWISGSCMNERCEQ